MSTPLASGEFIRSESFLSSADSFLQYTYEFVDQLLTQRSYASPPLAGYITDYTVREYVAGMEREALTDARLARDVAEHFFNPPPDKPPPKKEKHKDLRLIRMRMV